ncbi:hypothetical protein Z043_103415 [Scleropages formosus]|uniref:E3 ubiquitin/ISG15 ligase TRIM25-like n=1 Tax=Scleropages formosus TaxID=113540 RepID=A0A0P7V4P4_SCLFO|nr:hypothetical protein Z043_103415 [Scleropages formosus]
MVPMKDNSPMQEVTCAVCQDLFSDLHPLPCGHGFCPTCARGAWKRAASGDFQCPQCQGEGDPVPCDACPSQQGAAAKTCLRCEVSLCNEHLQPHFEGPAFRNHLLVEPLADLSARRCPKHQEMLRFYCMDECAYICADCVLEGTHTQHQVKGLRVIEDNLKVGHLFGAGPYNRQAEERLKESKRLLEEQEALESMLAETSTADSRQLEKLGVKLQAQVVSFAEALKEYAQRGRDEALLRLQESSTMVARDLMEAEDIHRVLGSLLQEKDPYLLIWVRPLGTAYTVCVVLVVPSPAKLICSGRRLQKELDAPLFSPAPITLDRKQMLEAIECKYHQFIAETMKSLVELKHQFISSPLTLDTNSAHPRLSISDDLRTAMRVSDRLPCSPHPDRFDHWSQVLTTQSFSSGLHYWEVEAEGSWDIAVVYGSIGRKGRTGTAFGSNRLSWSLMREHDGKLAAWHNKRKTRLNATMSGTRVSISLDYRAGKITFCEVGAELTHLHTFNCSFTQPVHLGFGLYKAELSSRISIVTVKDMCNNTTDKAFSDS